MKQTLLLATFITSTATPLLAISDMDITPAALVGKTLVFDIANGGAPFATTGSFSGTFAASGNGFTLANVRGDTVPVTSTYTVSVAGGFTNCVIPGFIEGRSDATLTLYIVEGVGNYEVSISDVFGVSLNGTFTIGKPTVKSAEIEVSKGKKTLKDGKGKVDFNTVRVTSWGKSRTKRLIITNTGDAPLKRLGYSLSGRNRGEFQVAAPKIGTIAPGGSVTIRVVFTPADIGKRRATLHIRSNDKNENPFDIRLTGSGGGESQ